MKQLTKNLFVAGQITAQDLDTIAAAGIKTIINNRPDGEEAFQPSTADLAAKATEHGIAYHDIPVAGQISPGQIEAFQKVLESSDNPILAFCRTGTRSSMLWAMSQAENGDIDDILGKTATAGYDFRGYRPMLESLKS